MTRTYCVNSSDIENSANNQIIKSVNSKYRDKTACDNENNINSMQQHLSDNIISVENVHLTWKQLM